MANIYRQEMGLGCEWCGNPHEMCDCENNHVPVEFSNPEDLANRIFIDDTDIIGGGSE
jgi:hypothetical protein